MAEGQPGKLAERGLVQLFTIVYLLVVESGIIMPDGRCNCIMIRVEALDYYPASCNASAGSPGYL